MMTLPPDLFLLKKNGRITNYTSRFTSIYQLLKHHQEHYKNHEAIVGVDVDLDIRTTITYQELWQLVLRTANTLKNLRIQARDRIGILMENTPEVMVIEMAANIIGATTVPLDSKRDTLERKLFKLKNTDCKLLFIKTSILTPELKALYQSTRTFVFSDLEVFKKKLDPQPISSAQLENINEETLYVILYTSGTTAHPKGVPLTLRALLANAEGINIWQQLNHQDKFNIVLPFHHINSTAMSLATILAGGTVVVNSRYSVSGFWKIISKEHCTITSVVPTIIHDLLMRYKDTHTTGKLKLKRILVGSAPVLPEETWKFYNTFQIPIYQGYGQTETALRVTGVPIDITGNEYQTAVESNTIGTELANCNVVILNSQDKEAKENEEGELCIRGPVLAQGYWNDTVATRESYKNGWFHSGDLGYFKYIFDQKHFFIKGRLKEIIIKGGINISPALIEDALLGQYPQIDEVSVVGYPDSRMGEEIAAVIVAKESDSKANSVLINKILAAASQNKIPRLSPYEIPRKIFIVNHIPKTSTGKIQRVEVKKLVAEKIKNEITAHYYVRRIKPHESQILRKAVSINNQRWTGLPASVEEFQKRARNGLLFGVFEEKLGLTGSLTCVQLSYDKVRKLKTWSEATHQGSLANQDPDGNTLLCVAISTELKNNLTENNSTIIFKSSQYKALLRKAKLKIREYIKSGLDHVLNFHKKPKGGISGAKVWKILENGRPEDYESCGFNILMKYPDISESQKISYSTTSIPSVMLIEYALMYARKHGIKHVIAFSRPAGFYRWLISY